MMLSASISKFVPLLLGQIAENAILSLMRAWPGLLHLAQPRNYRGSHLQALVDILYLKNYEVRVSTNQVWVKAHSHQYQLPSGQLCFHRYVGISLSLRGQSTVESADHCGKSEWALKEGLEQYLSLTVLKVTNFGFCIK